MLIKHNSHVPHIAPSAYIAPNAVICGQVIIGENARIMFGAQIIAENSPVTIGDNTIILENAVIRGTENNPVSIGSHCLIGPQAHLAGCTIEENVFIATGASIFHGAIVKKGGEVRINGVVHLRTVLDENSVVPISWVAVGDPAQIYPPGMHEEIYKIQHGLNFPKHVYGLERDQNKSMTPRVCQVMSQRLGSHKTDEMT